MNNSSIKRLLSEIRPPFQPEMLLGKQVSDVRWKVSEWNDASVKNLACFSQFQTTEEIGKVSMFPDNCIKFLFECTPGENASRAKFLGINTEKTELTLRPNTKYFIFMPYSHLVLNMSIAAGELQNMNTDIENALPSSSALVRCQELISAEKSFEENIDIVVKSAIRDIKGSYTSGISEYCSLAMCLSHGNISSENMELFTGYSSRHCRARFKDSYGFSPKRYSIVVRFQGALHELVNQRDKDALDIVNDHGYFDQAHFIKDFKKFTGLCPNEFRRAFAGQ